MEGRNEDHGELSCKGKRGAGSAWDTGYSYRSKRPEGKGDRYKAIDRKPGELRKKDHSTIQNPATLTRRQLMALKFERMLGTMPIVCISVSWGPYSSVSCHLFCPWQLNPDWYVQLGGTSGKEPTCWSRKHKRHTQFQSLGQEDPLKKEMATHSSIRAWKTRWTEESGGPESMGSQRVGHDWSDLACMHNVSKRLDHSGPLDLSLHHGLPFPSST